MGKVIKSEMIGPKFGKVYSIIKNIFISKFQGIRVKNCLPLALGVYVK